MNKLCPFCGGPCTTSSGYLKGFVGCEQCNIWLPSEQEWQTRPLEDALQKQIDQLLFNEGMMLASLHQRGEELVKAQAEIQALNAYADKLARGLPEGMLPKDIELLRESNAQMATTLQKLQRKLDRIMAVAQIFQPTGSPPPGDEPVLIRWILTSLTLDLVEAKKELIEKSQEDCG